MNAVQDAGQPLPQEAGKLITCVLPDDGSDKDLLHALREEKGITRAHSVPCRGVAVLRDAKSKRGRLPESRLAKIVRVVAPVTEAHALFDYMHEKARIGRPGGGIIFLQALIHSTPFVLPEGVPDEKA